eukprot:gnl/MRDRNA2_/MRDRNA2_20539_c0_seq1.p1 gnl/MRDRNA2_/MRDRNA2_20539_c0~~gnl/MRDRNA2_/MRDRNA2_20539_c0_seq1.p1  ORF type:complete len:208 (+),score=21.36 gnl/MRDRNA2_/MRDRNA2_20539_c0_seq1:100-723(+)
MMHSNNLTIAIAFVTLLVSAEPLASHPIRAHDSRDEVINKLVNNLADKLFTHAFWKSRAFVRRPNSEVHPIFAHPIRLYSWHLLLVHRRSARHIVRQQRNNFKPYFDEPKESDIIAAMPDALKRCREEIKWLGFDMQAPEPLIELVKIDGQKAVLRVEGKISLPRTLVQNRLHLYVNTLTNDMVQETQIENPQKLEQVTTTAPPSSP